MSTRRCSAQEVNDRHVHLRVFRQRMQIHGRNLARDFYLQRSKAFDILRHHYAACAVRSSDCKLPTAYMSAMNYS